MRGGGEDEEEETNFGGLDENGLEGGDHGFEVNDIPVHSIVKVEDTSLAKKCKRRLIYRDCDDFFGDILNIEKETKDQRFIDFLVNKKGFKVVRDRSKHKLVNDYSVSVLDEEWESIGRILEQDEFSTLRQIIRDYYEYVEWNNRRVLRRAGIATAIGVAFMGTIAGLSLALKHKGRDMQSEARREEKWKPLVSSDKNEHGWTPLTPAKVISGGVLVFLGDHIYIVLGGTMYYLYRRIK